MASDNDSSTAADDRPMSRASADGNNADGGDGWALEWKVKEKREREERSGIPPRLLGLTWNSLSVTAIPNDAAIHENFKSQFNIPRIIREGRNKPPLKTIIDNSHGCVKPGEMLLVLGRPGAGCTTLLSVLANRRRGFTSVEGDVFYGSMAAANAKTYRGQIVMNTEEELFFPTLTVGQTMDFASRLKVPFTFPDGFTDKKEVRRENMDFLLDSMSISHTKGTKVGDAFVRGVSGGERKRVSIIECMAAQGSIFFWDNSTRGLDAST